MDLIYASPDKTEIGIIQGMTFDLAYGFEENDFEITVSTSNHVCQEEYLIYLDGTEYGGVIDAIKIDTESDSVKYKGRSWHGIMEYKILEPDSGQDYLKLSGDANDVLWTLVQRMGLTSIFERSSVSSGINISNYQFERYTEAYSAIRKMLSNYSAKLVLSLDRVNAKVKIGAARAIDWSVNEPISSDLSDFIIEHNHRPINHLICGGEGELKERTIIHLYADASGSLRDSNGNLYTEPQLTGINEKAEFYDYNNTDAENLEKSGIERLTDYQVADSIDISLDTEREYDVGDIVTAYDTVTGVSATTIISKKVVSVKNDIVSITYDIGGYTESQIKQARKAADDASTAIRAADAAAAAAAIANSAAGEKRRVFTSQPVPPYDVGDLWIKAITDDNGKKTSVIMVCTTSKEV